MKTGCLLIVLTLTAAHVCVAQVRSPTENNFIIKNFRFRSGEMLPELRLHYRTLGTLQKDAQGRAMNAVLILHGTGGSGASLMQPAFAGELFKPGGVLDPSRYFVVIPDAVGHGA